MSSDQIGDLLNIVLNELQDSVIPVASDDPKLTFSPAEKKKLSRVLREFDQVSISSRSPSELWIQPMLMSPRGGGIGNPKDRIVFPIPNTNDNFLGALDIAYSRCAVVYGL